MRWREWRASGSYRLGSISKQGDSYLRSLFTAGALAVIRYAKIHTGAAPDKGRCDRSGQQACADGLGHDGYTRPFDAG
ncbi:MAG TPA: transposase [Phyllobacterium sp.]|nr:transposase [Phyllobacterium sp.]